MTISLRHYQSRTINEAREKVASGLKRLLVVGPTGCGKTTIFASIVESSIALGNRCLILAHRRELIKAPAARLLRAGLEPSKLGIVLAGIGSGHAKPVPNIDSADDDRIWECLARHRPSAPVQVASIDTLRARAKPPAELIIVDEAHRMLSASYLNLANEYPTAVVIGLTATPLRTDGKGLGDFFEDMITVATYRELVAEGFLVPPRVFTVPSSDLPDLSQVRIKGGDYDTEQLTAACDKSKLVGDVVKHWLRHGNDAPTFCFAVSREHSRHLVEKFLEAGVPAEHVDANTSVADREAAIAKLKSGAIKVLSNVDILTEGVDVPDCKTVILARPTKSVRVYMQSVGRGSRPSKSGKPFVVLDHAGVVIDHGLPHLIEFAREILWIPKAKSSLKSAPCKTCPMCFAVVPAASPVCEGCGHEFTAAKPRTAPEAEEGDLIEVTAPTEVDLRGTWDKLCEECIEGGFKPTWVHVRWGEMFPSTKPPAGCKVPSVETVSEVNAAQLADLDRRVRDAVARGHKPGTWKMGFKNQWRRYPSMAMFEKTSIAVETRALLAGLGAIMRLTERVPVATVAPTAPANDVRIVDWAV